LAPGGLGAGGGQPEFIEQEILATLRRLDINTPIHGKGILPMAGNTR
jgi:indolepyruvate ferredoxin oxidoreductase alpha subunit